MQTGPTRTIRRSVAGVALATALILMLPLVAMQFTEEVNWGLGDFVVGGALLFSAGLICTLAIRRSGNIAYRAAVVVAVAVALIFVWVNLAVGFVGP